LPPPYREGKRGRIVLLEKAKAGVVEIAKCRNQIQTQQSIHIERYFARFCDNGCESLDDKKYKFEKRQILSSGKSIPIFVFKAFKWRLYGTMINVDGINTFIGACIDDRKKQDKADPQQFVRAAEALQHFV